MSQYYCPFCSSRYQFHQTGSDGVLICGQCGDPLVKKPLVNLRRIIGVVAATAFLAPLLIFIFLVMNDFIEEKMPNDFETIVFLTINE